jgi:hypothetical protein
MTRVDLIGVLLACCLAATLSAPCVASDISVEEVPKNPATSPDGDFSSETTLITLSGKIADKDDRKFQNRINKYLKPTTYNSDSRGNLVLRLLNSEGGNLPAALNIADIVRKERISTFVPKDSKCISACAMIFLAGRRSIYSMGDRTDRVLEIGGVLGFHGPYEENDLDQRGMMVEGVSIVRRMMVVLGDALPNQLLIETSTLPPGQRKIVDSVYDVLRWDIQLIGFKRPAAGREALLNACINDAHWKHVRPIGIVAGLDNTEQNLSFLEDEAGQAAFDGNKLPLKATDYVLPSEGNDIVSIIRKTERAPDFLRDIRMKDGTYASQFSFSYEDETSGFWCSAVHRAGRREVEIYPRRLSLNALLRGKGSGSSERPDTVPVWFLYPPGLRLTAIRE